MYLMSTYIDIEAVFCLSIKPIPRELHDFRSDTLPAHTFLQARKWTAYISRRKTCNRPMERRRQDGLHCAPQRTVLESAVGTAIKSS